MNFVGFVKWKTPVKKFASATDNDADDEGQKDQNSSAGKYVEKTRVEKTAEQIAAAQLKYGEKYDPNYDSNMNSDDRKEV